MAEDVANVEELRANLKEYEEQLEQVGHLLLDDPNNEEYSGIYANLKEVIQLTRDLIQEAGPAAAPVPLGAAPPPSDGTRVHPSAAITAAPELKLPSILPPTVAAQIRTARQRAAVTGQAPASWAIGAPVQAVYREDGQWYNAVVTAISVGGKFIVQYTGYDTVEELERGEVRMRGAGDAGEGAEYTGVVAPKRRRMDESVAIEDMPDWLTVRPDDDDKTKIKKKKLQKSFKSKQRFARMDLETKEKASSWKNFVTGKGSKKKTGFMSGHKRESIFRVPDELGGRVGVVGSGKGMTQFHELQRHDFKGDGTSNGPAEDAGAALG